MQCKVCNSEMKTIPAGVSKKTGNPYNAFEACPNKCVQPRAFNNSQPNRQSDGQVAFKIMSDEFVNLKLKVEELIKKIEESLSL